MPGGEGDNQGWDGWMASLTRWTWVWASSGHWWWTGKPGAQQSIGLQRVRHNWVTTELTCQTVQCYSVQFSCSVMSDSFRPHGLQHIRLPCPSPTPGACSNSGPLSWWCHPTVSTSVFPFSSRLQSFPASGSFPKSQFLSIRGSKYRSFSFSISPSNEYSGLISFRMDWLDLLAVQGTSLIISYRGIFRVLHIQFNHIYLSIFMEFHFIHTEIQK